MIDLKPLSLPDLMSHIRTTYSLTLPRSCLPYLKELEVSPSVTSFVFLLVHLTNWSDEGHKEIKEELNRRLREL
ncbi:hypothetical protein GSbR_21870 [Geobacter sp. SVR]|nr:hypothetical protein GSVR_15950 [Geobacter sp. SVR]GCF85587.1 hypothetical protein GSbR_21870 [Geobacter sp. SVR]